MISATPRACGSNRSELPIVNSDGFVRRGRTQRRKWRRTWRRTWLIS
jgi:hypothetical protein